MKLYKKLLGSEKGASMLEVILPLMWFLLSILILLEVSRYAYMFLTAQCSVSQAARVGQIGTTAASSTRPNRLLRVRVIRDHDFFFIPFTFTIDASALIKTESFRNC